MFFPIGALTSKPYAFVSRPWEINSSEGIDFFDSFLSSIRLDERGLKVIRILPSVDSSRNEDWISDRIRFSYNSQNNQKLTDNFVFYNFNYYKMSNEHLSKLSFLVLSKIDTSFYDFGLPSPLELQKIFFDFSTIFNNRYLVLNSSQSGFNADSRTSYVSKFDRVKNYFDKDSVFFVVNFNTRFSIPVFNIFCRSIFSKSSYPIFYIGPSSFSNFSSYITLGPNPFTLFNIFSAKSKINKIDGSVKFSFLLSSSYNIFSVLSSVKDRIITSFYSGIFPINSSTSSIISSELNFSVFSFVDLYNFPKDLNSALIMFNSAYDFEKLDSSKFNFNFSSNFDFSDSNCKNDFLIAFPDVFSCSSTFFSIFGDFKSSNNYRKFPSISFYIRAFFSGFNLFFPFNFSDSNFPFKVSGISELTPEVNFSYFSSFNLKHKFFSDSFYSTESARSHYFKSPYGKFSIPLVLQYSRVRNTIFNHFK